MRKGTDGAFKEVVHDMDDEGLKVDEEAVVVAEHLGWAGRRELEEPVGEGEKARVEGVDVVCDGGVEGAVEGDVGGEGGGMAGCAEGGVLQRREMVVVHEEQHVLVFVFLFFFHCVCFFSCHVACARQFWECGQRPSGV